MSLKNSTGSHTENLGFIRYPEFFHISVFEDLQSSAFKTALVNGLSHKGAKQLQY